VAAASRNFRWKNANKTEISQIDNEKLEIDSRTPKVEKLIKKKTIYVDETEES